jgi:hypothetical protein
VLDTDAILKYYDNDENKIKDGEIPSVASHKSYLSIVQKNNERPSGILFTNGNGIVLIKIPGMYEEIDDRALHKLTYIPYFNGIKENTKKKDLIKMDEIPLGIAISQYNYYILSNDSITIISLISELPI